MVATGNIKTVSQEENDPNSRNPMLYDPLQDGTGKNSKKMQYVAALVVCLGAVSAGTALAWTSPVLPQISIKPTPANITINNSTIADLSVANLTSADLKIELPTSDNSTVFNSTLSNIFCNTSTTATTEASPVSIAALTSNELQLTVGQQTWVSSLLAIGAFFGALPSGYIADAIGRRYTALLMDIPFIVAWIATIFAKSAGMLYFARFMIGISTGSFCVIAPMYISEIAETSIRGALGTLFQLLLTVGILLVYIVGSFVHWTTLSVVCLFVPIGLFIGMLLLPETPTYLLKKGRRGDAALSLKWLWGRYCDSRSAIQAIQSDIDATSGNASFMDLFRNRAALNGFIISILLMFFQQFCGINAVIFYTVPIFQSAGSTLDPSVCSIIVGIVQVAMTLTSSMLIERAGRKVLLLFSSTTMTICLAILGAYFNMKDNHKDVSAIGWLPLLSVVMFIIAFSIGYGPIPWLMMGELFLPDVKATAVSLTVMVNWLSVFVVTKSFGSMITAWGSDCTFWFFGCCHIIATIYVAVRVLETKGKTPSQIQMWLGGTK